MVILKAYTFDGKRTARKVINAIEDSSEDFIWEDDVALISVNKHGHIRVHSTWAQDSSNVAGGLSLGTITGGVIGILFGPGGVIAGAAIGGTIGGLMGHHENVKFDDPELDNFAASLVKDTSALVLLGDEEVLNEFEDAVANYNGTVYEAVLDDEALAELENKMTN